MLHYQTAIVCGGFQPTTFMISPERSPFRFQSLFYFNSSFLFISALSVQSTHPRLLLEK